ncbi:IS21 family transposase [Fervidibacillus albus]|uniref:IS21 family transposase n=1 Tax=Fervidibacillus albus TaxID=2980026 RepID=A0A9E8LUD4_9BACI|nr:IS21 family transposase [Fervidibacillus albus]WAA08928.1 IS21 family transposase [Fervidibacillus albus]WAA09155.1 IS21 family transposase [Fervidibacillus albus]WAA09837.1 IS21 family transposase [Fervidibacillus albus]WAA10299.1 IS21 family transposase [Fervidibacillus albus]
MLQVTDIQYIRQEVNRKGCSYSDVARRTNVDYRTVKKYADMEEFQPNKKIKKSQPAPVMDPVKDIVDQWLREDLKKKKKYRRTAKRIWQLLVENENFKGSDRTVRAYVAKRKKELLEESNEAALPLEAKPGDAQVDFGEAPFKYMGKVVDLPFLVMSFPSSNAAYVQVFESQNQECFLEGLKRFFHHIGGVPCRIRFDNLTPAVKKILPHGKRILTEGFQQFALHYGFAYEFCNPASGNEKGHVESKVKYIRNNMFLPERTIYNLEDFNRQLWEECKRDHQRQHYEKKIEIAKLHEEERAAFLCLPAKEYTCTRYETVKADKYGFIQIDAKKYSTSPRFASQTVLVGITYNRVDIIDENGEIIVRHERIYGEKMKSMKWQPYLALMAKRPTALKYSTFYEQLPHNWQNYLETCTLEEKKKALQLLSAILKDYDFHKASEALDLAMASGHPSIETIKHAYIQLISGQGDRFTLQMIHSVPELPNVVRGMSQYDTAMFSERGGEYE